MSTSHYAGGVVDDIMVVGVGGQGVIVAAAVIADTAMLNGGNVVSIEIPKAVELTVTETTPQPKGATATNQMKDAELETGLKIRVPPFVAVGDMVRINTDDGSYLGRATK